MGDRAGRAARRAAQLMNQANVVVDIGRDMDGGYQNMYTYGEIVQKVVRVPRGKVQPPRAVPPLAMGPG